jgi:hypothetical protein
MAVTDEQILAFIESADWRIATTMAANEHWYVLERECGGAVFVALAERIERGEIGRYQGHAYRYLTLGDCIYWVMPSRGNKAGRVINRKRSDQAAWDEPRPTT